MVTFEIYKDTTGEFSWWGRSGGDITADIGESASKSGARESVKNIKKNVSGVETGEG